ncbi:hypothetical protein QQ045_016336 [Rhodiola kirilowii]
MEDRRERNGRMSVPQFGSWENQGGGGGGGPNNPADGYTMVFTKARADRKEQKAKPVPAHLGTSNDDNNNPPKPQHRHHRHGHHHHRNHRSHQGQDRHSHIFAEDETLRKKNILTYLNCCIRP